ncbi:hypothetical protein K439DRAFT_1658035 [Ramaria rubella]|nr:hypothetical protein K439DRAFT_1658035 [Ramaria rubella]
MLLPTYTAAALAYPTVTHLQLRNLLACPQRRGFVYYPSDNYIVEHDILTPLASPRVVIELGFRPTCFAATAVQSPAPSPTNANASPCIIFAAGGAESQLHISIHSVPRISTTCLSNSAPTSILLWKHKTHLPGGISNIVNYILLNPASLTDERKSDSDVRAVVCGNDMMVRVFDVVMGEGVREEARVVECGCVKLETCVNHVSISPSGTTLLCVGDTPKIYVYTISPGPTITFFPLCTYTLPPPPASSQNNNDNLADIIPLPHPLPAPASHPPGPPTVSNSSLHPKKASGRHVVMAEWMLEDVGLWGGIGVESGVRCVAFSGGERVNELLVWVEHTNNMHVIDARTFGLATHAVVPFPDLRHLRGNKAETSVTEGAPATFAHASTSIGENSQNASDSSPTSTRSNDNEIATVVESMDNESTSTENGTATVTTNVEALALDPGDGSRSRDEEDDASFARDSVSGGNDEAPRLPAPSTSRLRPYPPSALPPHLQSVAKAKQPLSPPQPEIHIAGLCFDPSGGWVYVAAQGGGVVEWQVREGVDAFRDESGSV